jgi:proline dehydrogenase
MGRAGEEISQIIVRQKKHAFFGNEVLRKMYGKEQYRKRKAEKG